MLYLDCITFFKFLKLRLELRINSSSCLCQWQQRVFLSRTLSNTQKIGWVLYLTFRYVYVCVYKECVRENTCKFLGVAKLRILGLLIHTYFHHWIEIRGGGRRMLFKASFFQVWENVRSFAWWIHTKSLCLALHKKQSPGGNRGVFIIGEEKAVKLREGQELLQMLYTWWLFQMLIVYCCK